MPSGTNHRIVLAERPANRPARPSDFRLETVPIPDPGPDEVLVRGLYLSLDPYMRGRMSAAKSYAPSVGIGDVMVGEVVGEIVRSNTAALPAGSLVAGHLGWQEWAVAPASSLRPVEGDIPLSYHLGLLGMPGMTAYAALVDMGGIKAGETVLISAASGAVGQVAGQIARLKGCRVIGIAGTEDKCAFLTGTLCFHGAIVHRGRTADDLTAAIRDVTPGGIDFYLDSTGGAIHDAAMRTLRERGRIIIIGTMAIYNDMESPDIGVRWLRQILVKRARVQGLIVHDHEHCRPAFLAEMGAWLRDEKLVYREDVVDGLTEAPEALIAMLSGQNFGKLVVKLGERGP